MADPLKAPNQTPLEADVRGRVLEAVSKGFLPESDDFFNFIGRGASYYKTKPASQRSMWDNLVRHSVFGGPDPNEIKAQTEQKAIIDYAKGIQKQFEGLPTAEEAGGFFKGGQLPFTPTMAQRQPIIPTPDEAAMLNRQALMQGPRRPAEQFQPLSSPIQPGQVIGMDPTRMNPQAKLTPFQSSLLEEAGKGQVILPGQQFLPTSLAKETKPDKPSFHYTTMFNQKTGREEEAQINNLTNEINFLGPKGSPEAAKAKKDAHSLEARREVENEAKTRIGRAFSFAGFKESPFDAAGNIDIARLLAPGAMDLDKLTYWAQSAIDEPGLQKPVKVQLEHFLKQIKDAAGRAKKAPEAPKAGSVLKFDSKGNPIK